MRSTTLVGATVLTLAAAATAQDDGISIFALNEIYLSHAGTDDQEYVEVYGFAGSSLDGFLILIVEGEGSNAGTLDRAWDLSGNSIPNDGGGVGFFVVGGAAVPNVDLIVGATNIIENGTETIYLVQSPNPAGIVALLDTDVDMDDDCSILDDLGGLVTTAWDLVGPINGDFTDGGDVIYDGAPPVGPDGSFLPAGIFREGDALNPWCTTTFLDFDDVLNLDQPRTPGAANTAVCAAGAPGFPFCFGIGCPCLNDDAAGGCANSSGFGAVLAGSGSTSASTDDFQLDASLIARRQNGLFYMGDKALPPALFFDGLQCVVGNSFRFLSSIQGSGETGTMSHTGFVAQSGGLIQAGTTWYFHCWYRDWPATPCGLQANQSNAWGVTFTP